MNTAELRAESIDLPALIRRAGAELYGRDPVPPLAALFDVSPRTVRRWLAGAQRPPLGAIRDLWLAVVRARAALLSCQGALVQAIDVLGTAGDAG